MLADALLAGALVFLFLCIVSVAYSLEQHKKDWQLERDALIQTNSQLFMALQTRVQDAEVIASNAQSIAAATCRYAFTPVGTKPS